MGVIYADIELINGADLVLAHRHIIGQDEVKSITVAMLVDTGSVHMCINENIQGLLQLPFIEQRKGQLADGRIVEYEVVGPMEVRFKNRKCSVNAMVLPGDSEPLLGAIPLEEMDLLVHPYQLQLIPNPEMRWF